MGEAKRRRLAGLGERGLETEHSAIRRMLRTPWKQPPEQLQKLQEIVNAEMIRRAAEKSDGSDGSEEPK